MGKQQQDSGTIGFIGQDGRTAVCAKVVNNEFPKKFNGCVIAGRTGMQRTPGYEDIENISTKDNKVESLVPVVTELVRSGKIKYAMPMSEDLFYQGQSCWVDQRCIVYRG
jgi:hypothetical protein